MRFAIVANRQALKLFDTYAYCVRILAWCRGSAECFPFSTHTPTQTFCKVYFTLRAALQRRTRTKAVAVRFNRDKLLSQAGPLSGGKTLYSLKQTERLYVPLFHLQIGSVGIMLIHFIAKFFLFYSKALIYSHDAANELTAHRHKSFVECRRHTYTDAYQVGQNPVSTVFPD